MIDRKRDVTFDLEEVQAETILTRQKRRGKRDVRDLRRRQTAREALEGLTRDVEIFGFTKGQFSLVQLIRACLDHTGPAQLTVSTWTAAHQDLTEALEFMESGRVTGVRWLVDFSFQRRSPELAAKIRQLFGHESVRVARNHAKFCMLTNAEWKLVIRTSMNLNHNPRFEDFTVCHDPELAAFLNAIFDEIWEKQPKEMANERPYDIVKHFDNDL